MGTLGASVQPKVSIAATATVFINALTACQPRPTVVGTFPIDFRPEANYVVASHSPNSLMARIWIFESPWSKSLRTLTSVL